MKTTMTAAEFDRRFDEGKDLGDAVDWSKAQRPGLKKKRVYSAHTLLADKILDRKERQRGILSSSLIKRPSSG